MAKEIPANDNQRVRVISFPLVLFVFILLFARMGTLLLLATKARQAIERRRFGAAFAKDISPNDGLMGVFMELLSSGQAGGRPDEHQI